MTLIEERQRRIVTTHVGSLPRPSSLSAKLFARMTQQSFDAAAFADELAVAVRDIVKRQRELGIDVVSDGEFSKTSFQYYVTDRLAGIEPPRYEDTEKTIDELKGRIAKTLAFVRTLDAKQIDAAAEREISFPLGPTNKGHMTGADYLTHFVLPNFYFHLTAAYVILRHCGVEIGKRDFLGAIPLRLT